MSKQENLVEQELLKEYYAKHFKLSEPLGVIGLSTFPKREFGFLMNNYFTRNNSFQTPSKLLEFLKENGPAGVYVGAVYSLTPSKETPIADLSWVEREFIFDLDLTDFDSIRTCGCKGKKTYCASCWTLIDDAMYFISETLEEDFGVQDYQWVFSGRRGVHCWVKDKIFKKFDQKLRMAIMDYLTLVSDEGSRSKIHFPLEHARSLEKRIYRVLTMSFFKNLPQKLILKETNFTKNSIEFILKKYRDKRFLTIEEYLDVVNQMKRVSDETSIRLVKAIMKYRYPRFDKSVSIDTKRLLRLPGSIHGSTGKKCTLIKDFTSFSPDDVETIWQIVK